MLKDMEEREVIEWSDSPWSSPVALVRKKNGDVRFCVHDKKLNDVNKDCFPPLKIDDDTQYTLARAKCFSTLHLNDGCCQVSLHPDDKEQTAFSSGHRLWQFNAMHFAPCSGLEKFEHLIESVLQSLL
jgi:hypothetical protein